MATIPKIKITDDANLREQIDGLYDTASKTDLAKWSISIAKHILKLTGIDYISVDEIAEGFKANELWQSGHVHMHDVRQSGLKIHRLAKENDNEIHKAALRAAGHAVSSAHMHEHSIIASDYAIKAIGLLTLNDKNAISDERTWQLDELKRIIKLKQRNHT